MNMECCVISLAVILAACGKSTDAIIPADESKWE